jgi:hypothetical protein
MKKVFSFNTDEIIETSKMGVVKGGGNNNNTTNSNPGGDETDKRPKRPTFSKDQTMVFRGFN